MEKTPPTVQTLFEPQDKALSADILGTNTYSNEVSPKPKDDVIQQVHPIFLTTSSESNHVYHQTYFDKFLAFVRLGLEGILKFIDILVDAALQLARLVVWVVAMSSIIIVVTLMTNTTAGLIDLLNNSIFQTFGIEKRIAPIDNSVPAPVVNGKQ